MKKMLIVLCGGALVVAGTVVYRTKTMTALSGALSRQILQIESAYDSIVTDKVESVVSAFDSLPVNDEGFTVQMTEKQRTGLAQIRTAYARLSKDTEDDLQKLNGIHRLQLSMHEFVSSFPPGHPIREDKSFIELSRAIGERGEVRKLLQAYNTNAKLWNNRMQGQLGSITASVGDLDSTLYPYLRFDGKTEKNQVISLGK